MDAHLNLALLEARKDLGPLARRELTRVRLDNDLLLLLLPCVGRELCALLLEKLDELGEPSSRFDGLGEAECCVEGEGVEEVEEVEGLVRSGGDDHVFLWARSVCDARNEGRTDLESRREGELELVVDLFVCVPV